MGMVISGVVVLICTFHQRLGMQWFCVLAAACTLLATVSAKTRWYDLRANFTFEQYVQEYGKVYVDPKESQMREKYFKRNLIRIMSHNAEPGQTWFMGLNEFADWSLPEFEARRLYKGRQARLKMKSLPPSKLAFPANLTALAKHKKIPSSLDWRDKGVVTNVYNQGDCGSCFAFSTTEAMESRSAIASGKLEKLSAQQVTSCTPNPKHCGGTGNCDGGVEALAYDYLAQFGGLASAKAYPYEASDGKDVTCRDKKDITPVATTTGHYQLPDNEYTPLMQAIQDGPVSVAIAVSDDMEFYEAGVYKCTMKKNRAKQCWAINHAVNLVGYGENKNGNMYWLVRNSWGADWGEDGYIRIKRFGEGKEPCGDDLSPGDGSACGPPYPKSVRVCGMSGIISDSTFPKDAKLIHRDD